MPSTIIVREFDGSQLSLYRECFSDPHWRHSFGVLKKDFDLDHYLSLIALTKYESVMRLLLLDESRSAVGFCHIQMVHPLARRCILTGGVIPRLVGTGMGAYLACVIIDYLFSKLNMNKICCKVYRHNSRSYKLVSKLGFIIEGTAREHEYDEVSGSFVDVHFFGLLRREYPNEVTLRVLKGVRYEYPAEQGFGHHVKG